MNKAVAGLSVVLAIVAATPAFARTRHHHAAPAVSSAPYEHVDSGYYPPRNWNEIEISQPGGGF